MRETSRSLGLYFMLTGGLGMVGGGVGLFGFFGIGAHLNGVSVLMAIMLLVYLGISTANFYIGWNLKRLLVEKPQIPVRFTVISLILSAVTMSVFGFLLNFYIWYQLKRLAREADVKLEQQTLQ